MKQRTLQSLFIVLAISISLAGCKAAKDGSNGTNGNSTLPVSLPLVSEGEVHENPESSDSWMVYVNKPHDEVHSQLKAQMDAEGGWDARSQSTYRKTINGLTYELSITRGRIPVGNEPIDPSLRDNWTTLFLRKI
jgi:hypothetical protein